MNDLLDQAKEAIDRSERFQGTGSELRNIREALRLLLAYAYANEGRANASAPHPKARR